MDRETQLREKLAELDLDYQERAKPIIDELAAIENRKSIRPLMTPLPNCDGALTTGRIKDGAIKMDEFGVPYVPFQPDTT